MLLKNDTDYSNSVIYKICCNDESITPLYIDCYHSIEKAKDMHKHYYKKYKNLQGSRYKFIDDNGGWDNWRFVVLENVNCDSSLELRQKCLEYKLLLNYNPILH